MLSPGRPCAVIKHLGKKQTSFLSKHKRGFVKSWKNECDFSVLQHLWDISKHSLPQNFFKGTYIYWNTIQLVCRIWLNSRESQEHFWLWFCSWSLFKKCYIEVNILFNVSGLYQTSCVLKNILVALLFEFGLTENSEGSLNFGMSEILKV